MNMLTPAEFVESYTALGERKIKTPAFRLFLLGVLAGLLIGVGGEVANTASHSIANVSAARIVSGMLFPFGLVMVILTGAELFTGNCLITISVLNKKATAGGVLRNLAIVYLGNFAGALLPAAACAYCGQFGYSDGGLAVYTIRCAVSKCGMSFGSAVVMGIFCNVLVCLAVAMSLSGKDIAGRAIGAYFPVCFFVICGFEHCVANMCYVPAGLFAAGIPQYAALAAEAGVNLSALTWGGFLLNNLIPVTMGNIIGGAAVGVLLWYCHGDRQSLLSRSKTVCSP